MHDVNHTRSMATHLAMTAVRVTAMCYTMYISKIKQLVQYNRILDCMLPTIITELEVGRSSWGRVEGGAAGASPD